MSYKLLKIEGRRHNRQSYEPLPEKARDRARVRNRDIESAEEIRKFVSRFRKRAGPEPLARQSSWGFSTRGQ